MKVREAIEQLSKLDPDLDLMIAGKEIINERYRYGKVDTITEKDGVVKLYADLDDYWDVEDDEDDEDECTCGHCPMCSYETDDEDDV